MCSQTTGVFGTSKRLCSLYWLSYMLGLLLCPQGAVKICMQTAPASLRPLLLYMEAASGSGPLHLIALRDCLGTFSLFHCACLKTTFVKPTKGIPNRTHLAQELRQQTRHAANCIHCRSVRLARLDLLACLSHCLPCVSMKAAAHHLVSSTSYAARCIQCSSGKYGLPGPTYARLRRCMPCVYVSVFPSRAGL